MAKTKTPSFVLELELSLNPHERKLVKKKLNIGRQIYNACLGEALKRLHKIQNDKNYQISLVSLKKLNSEINSFKNKKLSKEQRNLLKQLNIQKTSLQSELKDIELSYGYSEYQLHAWSVKCRQHFKGQIGASEIQKLATRAFQAIEKLRYHKAERVYFKKYDELISIENKSNKQGLRWKDGKVLWGKLALDVVISKKDVYAQEALKSKIKYIRIVPKVIRGKERFYVQFIQEGYPPVKKYKMIGPTNERVGIDPGTSTMSITSKTFVSIEELAPEIAVDEKKLRRIQRAMDRSRRTTNPQNFNTDGTVIKGRKIWKQSNRYKKLAAKRKELYRKITAKRKLSHETLANKIIAIGLDVRVEKMNYKGLQRKAKQITTNKKNGKINKKKRFGKSLSNRAPSMFLSILERKLNYYGQELKKADTKSLKASQFNHKTGEYNKKELSERWMMIDGKKVQRDLYSSFLIANTNDELDAVDIDQANSWYDKFLELHDIEVDRLKQSNIKTLKWYVK